MIRRKQDLFEAPGPVGTEILFDVRNATHNARVDAIVRLRAQADRLRALADEYDEGRIPVFVPDVPASTDLLERRAHAAATLAAGPLQQDFGRRMAERLRAAADELVTRAAEALIDMIESDQREPDEFIRVGVVRRRVTCADGSTRFEFAR